MNNESAPSFQIEQVELSRLRLHPRNYQGHPEDELAHIMKSIREHGFYRNIVISNDDTILAGHGVVEAARKLGYQYIPVMRINYNANDPRALKLLIGDNEIRHLAEVDDRSLTELLREINETDDLLGTGYDEMMVANLAMVTRPSSEIADLDAASQWIGLPEYDMEGEQKIQITVNFANEEDHQEFSHLIGITSNEKSIWWPKQPEKNDVKSIRFTSSKKEHAND